MPLDQVGTKAKATMETVEQKLCRNISSSSNNKTQQKEDETQQSQCLQERKTNSGPRLWKPYDKVIDKNVRLTEKYRSNSNKNILHIKIRTYNG